MNKSVDPGRPPHNHELFIRRGEDYSRIKREGIRWVSPFFTVLVAPSSSKYSRFGIVVSRRFGKAVMRNRAKRIFRELARDAFQSQLTSAHDYIVFPRRRCLTVEHKILMNDWKETLRKSDISPPDSQSILCEK